MAALREGRSEGLASQGRPELLGFHLSSPQGDLLEKAFAGGRRVFGTHGLVSKCEEQGGVPGLPSISVQVAVGPRRDPTGRRFGIVVSGTGVSTNPAEAWLAAVVEALERYCLASPHDPSRLVRASYHDVKECAVPVGRFGLFSEDQRRSNDALGFPNASDEIDWTWAYSLTTRSFVLIPAALAFASMDTSAPNNFTGGPTSTGVACHVSIEAALLSGLYEVVERDAVMITWLNRRQPPKVTFEEAAFPEFTEFLRAHFTVADIDFVLLDLTTDCGISTIACLALSDNPDRPAAVMGAAARAHAPDAARKALFEVAQILCGLQRLGWSRDADLPVTEVRSFVDHARFYACDANLHHLEFLTAPAELVVMSQDASDSGLAAPGELLARAVEQLAGVGLEILVVELTTADVASCGFRTFKVVVPGAVDISRGAGLAYLGSLRIRAVPLAMGWPAAEEADFNLLPCPLP